MDGFIVYLNLVSNNTHLQQVGLPGVSPTLPVSITLDSGLRLVIWTLAPSYTVMRNDVATLDVMAGICYTSLRVSIAYEVSAPSIMLTQGGGLWPKADGTDGIVGLKGVLRPSSNGKWFLPIEADIGTGSKNWQWNAFLATGYHFHWGDVTLGVRNLTYQRSGNVILQEVRLTGPLLGATFRW
jgi:hypothetical protein